MSAVDCRCRHRKAFFKEMEEIGVPTDKVAASLRSHEDRDFTSATVPPSLGRTVGQYLASPPPARSQFSHSDNYDAFVNALSAHDSSYRDMTCQSVAEAATAPRRDPPREEALLTLAESLSVVSALHRVPRRGGASESTGGGDAVPPRQEQGQPAAREIDFHACARSIAQEVMAEPACQPLFSLMPAALHHALLSSEANMVCGCGGPAGGARGD